MLHGIVFGHTALIVIERRGRPARNAVISLLYSRKIKNCTVAKMQVGTPGAEAFRAKRSPPKYHVP